MREKGGSLRTYIVWPRTIHLTIGLPDSRTKKGGA